MGTDGNIGVVFPTGAEYHQGCLSFDGVAVLWGAPLRRCMRMPWGETLRAYVFLDQKKDHLCRDSSPCKVVHQCRLADSVAYQLDA